MSNSDSFIEEVTEEVRRERLFVMMRRYGWIAVLVIVVIVGGAAYREYTKAQERAAAQALGDAMIAALAQDETERRAEQLAGIEAETPGGAAVLQFMLAAALANSDQIEQAIEHLTAISTNADLPVVYRHIATFKALSLQSDSLGAADRRLQYESLASPGAPLRLLAEEQLALIDISEGDSDKAIERLKGIIADAEVSTDLQQRASQVIVALGGTLDTPEITNG
jgi:hypothetical protein